MRTTRCLRVLVAFLLVAILPCCALGARPDGRGEVVTDGPSLDGRTAHAPIPRKFHIQNEGGSDNAGLCVVSSILADGMYQEVPGLAVPGLDEWTKQQVLGKGSVLWKMAKSEPGGYSPPKLEGLLRRAMPGEEYVSYLGDDYEMLVQLSARGYAIGVTMNTSSYYGYRPISHMVSGVHFDAEWACVVDNNDPGHFYWMPRAEFMRRWRTGGVGWAFWWTRLPELVTGNLVPAMGLLAAALFFQGSITLIVANRHRHWC